MNAHRNNLSFILITPSPSRFLRPRLVLADANYRYISVYCCTLTSDGHWLQAIFTLTPSYLYFDPGYIYFDPRLSLLWPQAISTLTPGYLYFDPRLYLHWPPAISTLTPGYIYFEPPLSLLWPQANFTLTPRLFILWPPRLFLLWPLGYFYFDPYAIFTLTPRLSSVWPEVMLHRRLCFTTEYLCHWFYGGLINR